MIDLSKEKLELNYPCNWVYKVIGLSQKDVKSAIDDILEKREYKLKASKTSSKGKFQSFNLELLVHNDDDRTTIYEMLGKHAKIKMVL